MRTQPLRHLAGFIFLMLWSLLAGAAATVTAVAGFVELTPAQGKAIDLVIGLRVEQGATIKTGDNSSVTLRFDDGQSISLSNNSNFVLNEYKFNAHKPAEGGFSATFLRGAMRAVTGLIGESNKQNFAIKTPTATMGIRGTDFNLHFDGRLFIQVNQGAVTATNSAGTSIFDSSQPIGIVSSSSSLPRPLKQNDLPTPVNAGFRQLSTVPITGQERKPSSSDPTCSDRR